MPCFPYAYVIHTQEEEAEDILITGFMEIFESLPNYKQEGSFEGWMKKY